MVYIGGAGLGGMQPSAPPLHVQTSEMGLLVVAEYMFKHWLTNTI